MKNEKKYYKNIETALINQIQELSKKSDANVEGVNSMMKEIFDRIDIFQAETPNEVRLISYRLMLTGIHQLLNELSS